MYYGNKDSSEEDGDDKQILANDVLREIRSAMSKDQLLSGKIQKVIFMGERRIITSTPAPIAVTPSPSPNSGNNNSDGSNINVFNITDTNDTDTFITPSNNNIDVTIIATNNNNSSNEDQALPKGNKDNSIKPYDSATIDSGPSSNVVIALSTVLGALLAATAMVCLCKVLKSKKRNKTSESTTDSDISDEESSVGVHSRKAALPVNIAKSQCHTILTVTDLDRLATAQERPPPSPGDLENMVQSAANELSVRQQRGTHMTSSNCFNHPCCSSSPADLHLVANDSGEDDIRHQSVACINFAGAITYPSHCAATDLHEI